MQKCLSRKWVLHKVYFTFSVKVKSIFSIFVMLFNLHIHQIGKEDWFSKDVL